MELKEEQLDRIRLEMAELKLKEVELAANKNFKDLIMFYMESWRKASMFETSTLYQKISFFYGRLGDSKSYENFVKNECQVVIGMIASEKEIKIGLNLFLLGMKYPYFSELDLQLIEDLYCDENYYEMIESLHIEEGLLQRPLRKFDKLLLTRTNSLFSDELLDDIYQSFLENNYNPEWINVKVYDRPSNSIRVVNDGDEVANKTQFIIDFNLLFNEFLDLLEKHFSVTLKEQYLDKISDESGMKDDPNHYTAGEYAFSVFESFAKSHFDSVNNYNLILFRRKLAKSWLEKINNTKRN